jgi:hypothetical protein
VSRWLRFRGVLIVSAVLYLAGLLATAISARQARFLLCLHYTVQGSIFLLYPQRLFYAPLFLCLGAWFGKEERTLPRFPLWVGFSRR